MNQAIAYIRVSTDRQANEGDSLAAQEERIVAYAKAKGLDLIQICKDEGVSGSIPVEQRPGGKEMFNYLHPGMNLIVVKFDRIFRDAANAMNMIAKFDNNQVMFHSLDFGGMTFSSGSSMSKAMLQMRAVFAELERSLARERTLDTIAHKRSKGERIGQIPFGYTADEDGILIEHPLRAEVIDKAKDMRMRGASFRFIAECIEDEYGDKGLKPNYVTVRRILMEE